MQGFQNLDTAVRTIFNLAVGIAATIFIVMLLIGGIQYLTSMGNEEATTKAKKLLVDSVIGIVIVAVAYAGGDWILKHINLFNREFLK